MRAEKKERVMRIKFVCKAAMTVALFASAAMASVFDDARVWWKFDEGGADIPESDGDYGFVAGDEDALIPGEEDDVEDDGVEAVRGL